MNNLRLASDYIYASSYDKALRAFRDVDHATFAGNSFVFVILGSVFGTALSLLNHYFYDVSGWIRQWWPIHDQHYKNPLSSTSAPALLFCVLPAALITWALYVRGSNFRHVLDAIRQNNFRLSTAVALCTMFVFVFCGALSKLYPISMASIELIFWISLSAFLLKSRPAGRDSG